MRCGSARASIPLIQRYNPSSSRRRRVSSSKPAIRLRAQQLAWQALENLRQQQASALAYFDCFWLFAVVMLALTFVVFLMKRSVAEKGARIGGA